MAGLHSYKRGLGRNRNDGLFAVCPPLALSLFVKFSFVLEGAGVCPGGFAMHARLYPGRVAIRVGKRRNDGQRLSHARVRTDVEKAQNREPLLHRAHSFFFCRGKAFSLNIMKRKNLHSALA